MTARPPAPGSEAAAADPLAPIRSAPADRPFVVAQLGQSLDGRIALDSGESRWINNGSALDHLHALRAAVDAVVVGAGTVAADDPRLNVRRVPGRSPARVVIDPSGRLLPDAKCLDRDGCDVYLVRGDDASVPPGLAARVRLVTVPREGAHMPPRAIVAALFGLGLRRLLVEGGAMTVSSFIADGAVDRLHVLLAPVILGSGKPGLALPPLARLADALRPRTTVHVLADGDVLFDCDLRTQCQAPQG
ncbi:MAG: RibD family protein [Hyphomicrobiaceae bacterium]|nr:RibD family protein [Hyphomicrobiaceae bacterium]